jgi:arginine deiminase
MLRVLPRPGRVHDAMSATNVTSEIGRLRTVLVHRPGLEIARITPDNKEALLFDDLLWLERACEEHDRFVAMMAGRGIEVLYFEDLLRDVLSIEDIRGVIIDDIITPSRCGTKVAAQLRRAMREAHQDRVVDVLLGGLLERELPDWGVDPLFADLVSDRFHYVLRPLPNLLFMRDNAAWINNGLVLNVLATPARERESIYMREIYRHHPRFRDREFPVWFGTGEDDHYPASIEGGDVLVLNDETVMIGLGERTAPAAVEILVQRLFAGSSVRKIVVVHLRRARAVMHLDTVFTMVDRSVFNVFPGLLEEIDVHVITPGRDGLTVVPVDGLEAALQITLGLSEVQFVATGGDAIGQLREQWDDGNNTLAIEPGVVIAYERNQETNRRLRDAGIEVLELDASELCRGRGGSRCMTQPILRDPLS